MNFYSLIEDIIQLKPTNVAIKIDGKDSSISYAELGKQVSRYLNTLSALGVSRGDRIVVQVDKSLPSLFLYLACLKGGCVFIPLNTAYKASELIYFISDAEPKLFVTSNDRYEEISALVDDVVDCTAVVLAGDAYHDLSSSSQRQPEFAETRSTDVDEIAVIIYTSGTTGRSKGAM